MPHSPDMDESSKPGEQGRDWLVDLLYGELGDDAAAQAETRMRGDDELRGEFDALGRVRSLMRALPEEEPPANITAKLLHAAALHSNAAGSARALHEGESERRGLLGWLSSLVRPLIMYPGLAAATSLVLVAGVAGVLYWSGRDTAHEQIVSTTSSQVASPAPAGNVAATSPVVAAPDVNETTAKEGAIASADPAAGAEGGELTENQPAAESVPEPAKQRRTAGAGYRDTDGQQLMDSKRYARIEDKEQRAEAKPTETTGAPSGSGFAGKLAKPTRSVGSKGDSIAIDLEPATQLAPVPDDADEETRRKEGTPERPEETRRKEGTPERPEEDDDVRQDKGKDVAKSEQARNDKSTARATTSENSTPATGSAGSSVREREKRAVSLHSEARDAARAGDCKSALQIAQKIRTLDAGYYSAKVVKDDLLARCRAPSNKK